MTEPKIYIACRQAYYKGKLVGGWISYTDEVNYLDLEIDKILRQNDMSKGGWLVLDHVGFPKGLEPQFQDTIVELETKLHDAHNACQDLGTVEALARLDSLEQQIIQDGQNLVDMLEELKDEL